MTRAIVTGSTKTHENNQIQARVPERDHAVLQGRGRGHPTDPPVLPVPGGADVGRKGGRGDARAVLQDGAGG